MIMSTILWGMNALMANADIFSKINVPKYLFVISKNVSALINFSLTLCIFFLFYSFFQAFGQQTRRHRTSRRSICSPLNKKILSLDLSRDRNKKQILRYHPSWRRKAPALSCTDIQVCPDNGSRSPVDCYSPKTAFGHPQKSIHRLPEYRLSPDGDSLQIKQEATYSSSQVFTYCHAW